MLSPDTHFTSESNYYVISFDKCRLTICPAGPIAPLSPFSPAAPCETNNVIISQLTSGSTDSDQRTGKTSISYLNRMLGLQRTASVCCGQDPLSVWDST